MLNEHGFWHVLQFFLSFIVNGWQNSALQLKLSFVSIKSESQFLFRSQVKNSK